MTKILLVDDDNELLDLLTEYLSSEGFDVASAEDGDKALQMISGNSNAYDVIVLDVMMPQLDGFDVLERIRIDCNTPVIMLTARGDEADRIDGLELGADDYLPKPCNPRELVARVRAILRRTQNDSVASKNIIRIGDLEIARGSRSVTKSGNAVNLTSTEYSVLESLAEAAGKIVSKNDLATVALGRTLTLYDRSLDMHISNIRKKLGLDADGNELIKTVRGRGYLYVLP
jgi:DNA-binding response OmpR family regulator